MSDAQPRSRHDGPGSSPGFLLWRVTLRWQREMRAALEPHELTHVQFVLLAAAWWLARAGGRPPSQAELARQAGTDAMMTSQVLRRLQGRGLVARRPDPDDSRARLVSLTDAGRAALRPALAAVEEADAAFFAGADEDRLVASLRALAG